MTQHDNLLTTAAATIPGLNAAASCLSQLTSKTKVYIFSDSDNDGLISSAIFRKYFRHNAIPFRHDLAITGSHKLTPPPISGDVAIILDLGMNDNEVLTQYLERFDKVIVIDHHLRNVPKLKDKGLIYVEQTTGSQVFSTSGLAGLLVAYAYTIRQQFEQVAHALELGVLGQLADLPNSADPLLEQFLSSVLPIYEPQSLILQGLHHALLSSSGTFSYAASFRYPLTDRKLRFKYIPIIGCVSRFDRLEEIPLLDVLDESIDLAETEVSPFMMMHQLNLARVTELARIKKLLLNGNVENLSLADGLYIGLTQLTDRALVFDPEGAQPTYKFVKGSLPGKRYKGWMPGLTGCAMNVLVRSEPDKNVKPAFNAAFLITESDADNTLRISCRTAYPSINGVKILADTQLPFLSVGGHAQACGATLESSYKEELISKLQLSYLSLGSLVHSTSYLPFDFE